MFSTYVRNFSLHKFAEFNILVDRSTVGFLYFHIIPINPVSMFIVIFIFNYYQILYLGMYIYVLVMCHF
jgi:hypothetical protein